MELVLIALLVNILTDLSDRFKISKTYLALGLSVVGGAIYFYFTTYNIELWKVLVANVAGIYASSQLIYNLIKKVLDK